MQSRVKGRPTACSVVILTYNSLSTLSTCIQSVLETIGTRDEVIVVDNNSVDGTRSYLEQMEGCDRRLHVIYNTENVGFAAGSNVGIRRARHEYVVLLNPDTIVRGRWLETLTAHFKKGLVGAVGPLSDIVAGPQWIRERLGHEPCQTLTQDQVAEFVATNRAGRSFEVKLLIGFCLMLRRSILETIGFLDEDLFLGNDDLEISWRLRRWGYRLLVAEDTYVQHLGGASFASLIPGKRDQLLEESNRRLAEKLEAHYGRGHVPSSVEIWGLDIFKYGFGVGPTPQ